MNEKLAASGIILAGGRSSRIGRDKGLLALGGIVLGQRTVDFLKDIFNEIIFVTNQPQSVPWADGLVVVQDEVPFQGPLGGISAGLQVSEYSLNFVVATDMPFLSRPLIYYLMNRTKEADIVVPKLSGGFEPLHAVYSKNCLPAIVDHLRRGDNRMVSFYEDVEVACVGESELRKYDPELLSFFNVNTWEDYEKAQDIFQQREG